MKENKKCKNTLPSDQLETGRKAVSQKKRLKRLAKEMLGLLEGLRKAEEEWALLVFRATSRPRREGKEPWK
ncbi:MAG: hypothetical protein GTN74_03835 [Proteobacteria bacterium]|nr:hypothetical protein [Pseudomonadota bacterium]NIS68414.1 hypothetical protein [Pseudomonadota bacterium]